VIRVDHRGLLPAVGLAVAGVGMMVLARLIQLVDDAQDCFGEEEA